MAIDGVGFDSKDTLQAFIDRIKEKYLEKSAAQTQFMSSPATFVVNSDETLAAWAAHTAGNDYSSVYIASGTYTLPSGGIN